MTWNRVGIVAAVLLVAGTCWAAADRQTLTPRKAMPKTPTALLRVPEDATGRVIVKFTDRTKARVEAAQNVVSRANTDMDPVNAILAEQGVTMRPAINFSAKELAELEARAAAYSGKAQPDLAGMTYLEGPIEGVLAAAKALNDLDLVEYVEFETWNRIPEYGGPSTGNRQSAGKTLLPNGACCNPDGICTDELNKEACDALGGVYLGDGTVCALEDCSGACCYDSGACKTWETQELCESFDAHWQGPLTDCDTAGCNLGACCAPDNSCTSSMTQANCLAIEGAHFVGYLTTCGSEVNCGACCMPDSSCEDSLTQDKCENKPDDYPPGMDGFYLPSITCDDADCEEAQCGAPGTGSCFAVNGSSHCDGEDCCESVCELDPYCCDADEGTWDDFCVVFAHLLCDDYGDPDGPDPCQVPFNGSCYEIHATGGCNNSICCATVIEKEPFCENVWSEVCVQLALEWCGSPDDTGSTPDFETIQGYKFEDSYFEMLGEIPEELDGFIPLQEDLTVFLGFGGDGFDMEGLYDLGDSYVAQGIDMLGLGNLTRGKTINVAVIERAFWQDHEDLDVTVEPGQTLIEKPSWLYWTDHATACLGIIGAKDNNKGVTGLAPHADLYFFPMVSVEEGPRPLTAWISAARLLSPGDIISASYGPSPGNLNTSQTTWTLMDIATDLGILPCVSAGNSCRDLSGFPDFGDSGACVVGACSPGYPFYRLAFSNYYTAGDVGEGGNGNVVHISAWGDVTVTSGYGDLFFPDNDPARAYTASFNGTSSAAPQIAGLAACLQGLAKQIYGIPLRPALIRTALLNGAWPQGGLIDRVTGGFVQEDEGDCALDLNPDLGPNYIGDDDDFRRTYPRTDGAAAFISTTGALGFDQSPFIDEIVIVRGKHIFGNHLAVKARDTWYLVVEAMYTDHDWDPSELAGFGQVNPLSVPEILEVEYLAIGDITDIVAVGHLDSASVRQIAIETEVAYPGVTTLLFIEAFDWLADRWSFVDVQLMTQTGTADDGDNGYLSDMTSPSRFVRYSDNRILIRYWTLGFTGGGGYGGGSLLNYRQAIDFINLQVQEQFGEQLP